MGAPNVLLPPVMAQKASKAPKAKADPTVIDGVAVYEHRVLYPRSRIIVDERYNPRDDYHGMEQIARSLEKDNQLVPIYATPAPDGKVAVRDGYTRIRCVDMGLCPKFADKDEWKVIILYDGPASPGRPLRPLPERIIRRYCATLNRHRRNWTELEEARYYKAEIDEGLALRLLEVNDKREKQDRVPLSSLPEGEAQETRAAIVAALAQDEGITTVTVNDRLRLLELCPSVRKAVRNRLIPVTTAKQFHGVEDEEARQLLSALVQRQGYELDWEALDRHEPFMRKRSVEAPPIDGLDEAEAAAEDSKQVEMDVPDPTKSTETIPKSAKKKKRVRRTVAPPADGSEGSNGSSPSAAPTTGAQEGELVVSKGADGQLEIEGEALHDLRRGLRERHVKEAVKAAGVKKGARRRKPNASPRKMRRSDDELTGALVRLRTVKKEGSANDKKLAQFGIKLIRYVLGETDEFPL